MSMCSYCLRNVEPDLECFGWDEAKGCSGITGPGDPIRLQRQTRLNARRAQEFSDRAAALEAEAAELRRRAASLLTS